MPECRLQDEFTDAGPEHGFWTCIRDSFLHLVRGACVEPAGAPGLLLEPGNPGTKLIMVLISV